MTTSQQSTTGSGGVSIGGLLGVLFVGLKLGGVITWPWLWVLAPFWVPLAILAVILVVWGIVAIIAAVVGR